jgi:hypothetical protein
MWIKLVYARYTLYSWARDYDSWVDLTDLKHMAVWQE